MFVQSVTNNVTNSAKKYIIVTLLLLILCDSRIVRWDRWDQEKCVAWEVKGVCRQRGQGCVGFIVRREGRGVLTGRAAGCWVECRLRWKRCVG